MIVRIAALTLSVSASLLVAQLDSGPALPHKLVKDWPQLPAGWNLGEKSGVAVDKDDHVWVFNRGPHPIIELDRAGKMVRAFAEVPVTSSHGIRADPEGMIWAVDVKGHMLYRFDTTGRMRMVFGNAGKRPGDNNSEYAFNEPTGIAFAPGFDHFYVSDGYVNSRVLKYTRDGRYVKHWGAKGKSDGQFDLVHDVAVDSRGRVYVADRSNSRVQIFDADGKFLGKWTNVGQPWGLVYHAKENVLYMCDGQNNRVVKLNLDGQILGVLGSFGKAPGQFDFAHNIAVDSTGAIYVAEIKNWRVQKFAP